MGNIGEFALACDLKNAAENHFRSLLGECDTVMFKSRECEDGDNEDFVYIKIRSDGRKYIISVRKDT